MSVEYPLVSIIIPCYNCEDFIGSAISSCLSQTYENIEIIVIEDCGSDRTYERAAAFRDVRLSLYRNEKNLGQHGTKNRGLELSKGTFVKYCDGDDRLEAECVEEMLADFQAAGEGVGIAVCRSTHIDVDGKPFGVSREHGISGRLSGRCLLQIYFGQKCSGSFFGNPTAVLFSREALQSIQGFPKDRSWSGDFETFLKVIARYDAVFSGRLLAQYREQPLSVGSTRPIELALGDNLKMVRRLREDFLEMNVELPESSRDWGIWVNRTFVLSHYYRRVLGRPNKWAAVESFYREASLFDELRAYVRRSLPGFLRDGLLTKIRAKLGMPAMPRLFHRSEVKLLKISRGE